MSDSVMSSEPLQLAIVGAAPAEIGDLYAQLLCEPGVSIDCVCLEGVEDAAGDLPESLDCYTDLNVLLERSKAELVIVTGPVERRRDLAVRALDGGRHVVTTPPFAETPRDGARIMKTAARQGLMATMNIPWRSDPDLCALLAALQHPEAPRLHSLAMSEQQCDGASGISPAVLDMVNLALPVDVRSVMAYPDAMPGRGYMLMLPLRGGGWATVRVTERLLPGVPRFIASGAGGEIVVDGGRATIRTVDAVHVVEPGEPPCFWSSVCDAVRIGQPHPFAAVQIVRGMKLHSAAEESALSGEAVSI
jgi:Oxidoreductase family, NAD-binding Rossmann fold